MRRTAALLFALTLGCEAAEAPTAASDAATDAATDAAIDAERLAELRALGYIDFTDTVVDVGEKAVTVYDPERSWPGYNLVTLSGGGLAQLVDAHGAVVHQWKDPEADRGWSNPELLAGGDLLVPTRKDLARFTWDGRVRWRVRGHYHHDVERTPRNTVVALAARPLALRSGTKIRDNILVELKPNGRPRKRLSLYQVLAQSPLLFSFQDSVFVNVDDVVDLLHANSIEFMRSDELAARHRLYALDNVVVSMRHQDSVVVVDWKTNELVWAWGQGVVSGPHDATVLPSGNFLIFDNGLERGWSRVIELDPLSREIVWEYRAPDPADFYTRRRGSNQRLPNGNTLIGNSDSGKAFEVTPGGDVVWRYRVTHTDAEGHRATFVRIYRYSPETIDRLKKQ